MMVLLESSVEVHRCWFEFVVLADGYEAVIVVPAAEYALLVHAYYWVVSCVSVSLVIAVESVVFDAVLLE